MSNSDHLYILVLYSSWPRVALLMTALILPESSVHRDLWHGISTCMSCHGAKNISPQRHGFCPRAVHGAFVVYLKLTH